MAVLDAHIIMNNSTGLIWWARYALEQGTSLPPSHVKRLLLRYVTHSLELVCMDRFLPVLSELSRRFIVIETSTSSTSSSRSAMSLGRASQSSSRMGPSGVEGTIGGIGLLEGVLSEENVRNVGFQFSRELGLDGNSNPTETKEDDSLTHAHRLPLSMSLLRDVSLGLLEKDKYAKRIPIDCCDSIEGSVVGDALFLLRACVHPSLWPYDQILLALALKRGGANGEVPVTFGVEMLSVLRQRSEMRQTVDVMRQTQATATDEGKGDKEGENPLYNYNGNGLLLGSQRLDSLQDGE